ncbi:RHS repeat-associated core domain-containing protein, partial [Paenibacillus sp. LK1]
TQLDDQGDVAYYVNNIHGDVTHLTAQHGEILNAYTYDAFGNMLSAREQRVNSFRYAGEMQDALTGHYYLRARFYNPLIARFTQEDTYRGDGLNLYAYVANNPIRYVDPSGYMCEVKGETYANPKDKVVKEYDVVPYRPTTGKYGLENHHGVMNGLNKMYRDILHL